MSRESNSYFLRKINGVNKGKFGIKSWFSFRKAKGEENYSGNFLGKNKRVRANILAEILRKNAAL